MIPQGGVIVEFVFDVREIELLAVDGAVSMSQFYTLPPSPLTEQTMKVNARHTHQGQHDRLGNHETIHLRA